MHAGHEVRLGSALLQVLDCEGKKSKIRGVKEVEALVDDLGIDAANPCIVLTQVRK